MKPKILFSSTLLMSMIAVSSCTKTPDPGPGNPNSPDTTVASGFNFATVSENTININLIDMQGSALPGVKLSLYGQNPIDPSNGTFVKGIDTLATAQSDATGAVTFMMNVPKTTSSLFLVTDCFGYVNPTEITLNNGGVNNIIISPAGYVAGSGSGASFAERAATSTNTQPVDVRNLRNNIYTLSGWDGNGLPDYRTTINDAVPTSVLTTLSVTLPEGKWEPTYHPEFFTNPKSANINIIEDAQVWVTFVSEGAGYKSAMGYFTYPTNNPPKSASQISQMYVLYPNCSFPGSGGNLNPGTKVELVINDGKGGYTNRIPEGTSIGWFLISNGFNGNSIGSGNWTLYSFDKFNPGGFQQTIVLNSPENRLNFISFEDIVLSNGSCDGDFNDVMFYCTASPYEAIDQTGIPVVIIPKDTDGDGVPDVNDAYPNDPTLAYDSYYPAKGVMGTMAYEDLWPATGDYDFNDLVVDFNFQQQLNAKNQVVNILASFSLRAVGSSYRNGFALGLNTNRNNIKSVSGTRITGSLFSIGANGAETANNNAVIPIFADGFTLFGNRPMTNTIPGQAYMDPVALNIVIKLATPISQSSLGAAPYDPFMVIAQNRSREVHLMNHNPTSLVNMSLFGTDNDRSNPANGIYYVAQNGKPWAIQLPKSFAYPIEKANVSNAFPHFNQWAASGGTLYQDWYSNTSGGYRNSSLIYSH